MSKTNTLIYYVIPITIAILFYIMYRYYIFLFVNIREKFTNKTKMCNDNSCGMGCKVPNEINDDCPLTVYKGADGKCHRKCPYKCKDVSKSGCRYNQCCFGCGYKKFSVPCDFAIDEYDDDDSDEEPAPDGDKNTTNNSNNKSKNLSNNMTNVDHKDMNFKGWSPFVTKWPCSLNVTGTFTECGPPGYNSCSESGEYK